MAFRSNGGYDGVTRRLQLCSGEGNMELHLSAIHLYPVKGIRGVAVDRAEITSSGLVGDRRWVIVDDSGKFISQRSHPGLALVTGSFDGRTLTLTAPGGGPISIPVPDGNTRLTTTVWSDTIQAAAAGPEADLWLSGLLEHPVHLGFMDDACIRPISSSKGRPGETVSFADGYPLLVISRASLEDLNSRLPEPLPMDRFRPNLVVDGCSPFAEDRWRRFRIGQATFRCAGLCARCSVTTVDQQTGLRTSEEPLKTLIKYRNREEGVVFGVNLIPETLGIVSQGDRITLL